MIIRLFWNPISIKKPRPGEKLEYLEFRFKLRTLSPTSKTITVPFSQVKTKEGVSSVDIKIPYSKKCYYVLRGVTNYGKKGKIQEHWNKVVLGDGDILDAPKNLSAKIDQNGIMVSWGAVDGAEYYEIKRASREEIEHLKSNAADNDKTFKAIAMVPGSETSFIDTDIERLPQKGNMISKYVYYIRAVGKGSDGDNLFSSWSSVWNNDRRVPVIDEVRIMNETEGLLFDSFMVHDQIHEFNVLGSYLKEVVWAGLAPAGRKGVPKMDKGVIVLDIMDKSDGVRDKSDGVIILKQKSPISVGRYSLVLRNANSYGFSEKSIRVVNSRDILKVTDISPDTVNSVLGGSVLRIHGENLSYIKRGSLIKTASFGAGAGTAAALGSYGLAALIVNLYLSGFGNIMATLTSSWKAVIHSWWSFGAAGGAAGAGIAAVPLNKDISGRKVMNTLHYLLRQKGTVIPVRRGLRGKGGWIPWQKKLRNKFLSSVNTIEGPVKKLVEDADYILNPCMFKVMDGNAESKHVKVFYATYSEPNNGNPEELVDFDSIGLLISVSPELKISSPKEYTLFVETSREGKMYKLGNFFVDKKIVITGRVQAKMPPGWGDDGYVRNVDVNITEKE